MKRTARHRCSGLIIIAAAVIVCAIAAVLFLNNPAGKLSLTREQIDSARSYDGRTGQEPVVYSLNESEIDELAGRLHSIHGSRRSEKYGGLTPYYQISISLHDGARVLINGYRSDEDWVDLEMDGQRYVITDAEFNAYLSRFCAGHTREEALPIEEVQP